MTGNPLRIAIISSVHLPTDARIFHRQATALAEAGHEVRFFVPFDGEPHSIDGVEMHPLPPTPKRWQRPMNWWRLLRAVLRFKADVVHLHDPELLFIVPGLRLARGRRLRIIYDSHEYFVASLYGKHWYPNWMSPAVAFAARSIERLLVTGVDGIVTAVEGQHENYRFFKGPLEAVRNLPKVETFAETPPAPAMNVGGLRLVYTGLILEKRGVGTLLDAMRLLRDRGITDARLLLVGRPYSPAYISHIEDFARDNGLSDRILYLGAVPHGEIAAYMRGADIGMAPGLRTKQYSRPAISTKLFEYMLCELPIISADHGHRSCYLEEADCGLSVAAEDPAAWADAVEWMRSHPDEARAMGRRGREMVLAKYSWDSEKHTLHEFYRRVCADGAPTGSTR